MLLTFIGGFVALLVVIKFLHHQSFIQLTTSRDKIDWGRFFFGFGIIAFLTITTTAFDFYSNPENYLIQFEWKSFSIMFLIAIVLIPLQTSFEEYFFRGYLMQSIGLLAKNKWVPLVVTSLVFGLLHISNPEIGELGYIILVIYIGTGFFLGIITLMDDGLELALGFHAANNLFTALLVTADWTAFQTHSIFKDMSDPTEAVLSDVLAPVLIIFPILLFIFAKVYKWNNWKEKLIGRVHDFPNEDYKIIGEPEED